MGVNVLRWLFPRQWRDRYFEEMVDLNRFSQWRSQDLLDIVRAALRLRSEEVGRHPLPVGSVSALLALGGVAGLVWCLPLLSHGWIEVPSHWWSAPWQAATLAGVAGLLWVSRALLRRRPR